jgi:hypothetical protein
MDASVLTTPRGVVSSDASTGNEHLAHCRWILSSLYAFGIE